MNVNEDEEGQAVYDAYDTIEVSYMDQSESTRDPLPVLIHVDDPTWQDQDTAPLGLSTAKTPPRKRLFYRQVTGQTA